jgi:hypothetical protein
MPRFLIQTPVPGASTDIGNVHFHLGKAEMDVVPMWLRQYCEAQGYSITDQEADAEPAVDGEVGDDDGNPVTPPPANATVAVWREHVLAIGATEAQVDGLTKDQLKELAAELAKGSGQQ